MRFNSFGEAGTKSNDQNQTVFVINGFGLPIDECGDT